MSCQTVFRLHGRGAFENVKPASELQPTINKHEVLVKIRALSLNYRDLGVADGTYPFPVEQNIIPVSDAAGDIVEVGSCVDQFSVGDRVVVNFDPTHFHGPIKDTQFAHGSVADGFLREYAAVAAGAVVKVPEKCKLGYAELASLVCTGTTAWNSLYGLQRLMPGQSVLFQGTGGVSVTGLAIAKAAGAVTIITSSSDEKLEIMKRKYGADYTINYKKTPNWAEEVNKITGGRGVDFILETGGSGTIKQSIKCIAMGGMISVIGFLAFAKQEEMPDVTSMVLAKNCIVRGVLVGPKHMLEEVVNFVSVKGVRPPVEKVFGFSAGEVLEAFKYLKSGDHVGKVCIQVA